MQNLLLTLAQSPVEDHFDTKNDRLKVAKLLILWREGIVEVVPCRTEEEQHKAHVENAKVFPGCRSNFGYEQKYLPEMVFGGVSDQVVAAAFWASTTVDFSRMELLKQVYANSWGNFESVATKYALFVRVSKDLSRSLSTTPSCFSQEKILEDPQTVFMEGLARIRK